MNKPNLSPAAFRQLVHLSRKLHRIVELSTQARDPRTGSFKPGVAITADAIRASWRLVGRRAVPGRRPFQARLLAALRAPRQ